MAGFTIRHRERYHECVNTSNIHVSCPGVLTASDCYAHSLKNWQSPSQKLRIAAGNDGEMGFIFIEYDLPLEVCDACTEFTIRLSCQGINDYEMEVLRTSAGKGVLRAGFQRDFLSNVHNCHGFSFGPEGLMEWHTHGYFSVLSINGSLVYSKGFELKAYAYRDKWYPTIHDEHDFHPIGRRISYASGAASHPQLYETDDLHYEVKPLLICQENNVTLENSVVLATRRKVSVQQPQNAQFGVSRYSTSTPLHGFVGDAVLIVGSACHTPEVNYTIWSSIEFDVIAEKKGPWLLLGGVTGSLVLIIVTIWYIRRAKMREMAEDPTKQILSSLGDR
jgi:hypothetical protein